MYTPLELPGKQGGASKEGIYENSLKTRWWEDKDEIWNLSLYTEMPDIIIIMNEHWTVEQFALTIPWRYLVPNVWLQFTYDSSETHT